MSTVGGNGKIHDINNKGKQKTNDNEKEMKHNKRSRGTGGNIGLSKSSTSGFHVDSAIVSDILSRLPVKSIVRFKCVCKHWQLLIEEDSYFIDLHLNRSKKSPILLFIGSMVAKYTRIFIPEINKGRLVTVMLEGERSRSINTVRSHNKEVGISIEECIFFGPVNGLIGYESDDSKNSAIRICNISTQEITPWIKSPKWSTSRTPYYELGFDPVAKKHKVICICRIYDSIATRRYGDVCEVLTVGDKKWRRIQNPPFKLELEYYQRRHTLYLNGFIYYCTSNFMKGRELGNDKIVAFDVGAEKFRVITVPNFIRNEPRYFYRNGRSSKHLIELEGRLALLSRMGDYTAKLWVFDDDVHGNNNENNTSTSISSSNQNWTEVPIELPYSWSGDLDFHFHSVLGTDQIIIESYEKSKFFELHCYNWITMSCKKIDTSGFKYYPSKSRVATLVESLLPIQ